MVVPALVNGALWPVVPYANADAQRSRLRCCKAADVPALVGVLESWMAARADRDICAFVDDRFIVFFVIIIIIVILIDCVHPDIKHALFLQIYIYV